ncbi:PREDICTED: cilia- and flagella-associated protein 70 [Polistes canadensis]|uniref:cilia- and flagella-associated protein 70 n=1 Tax=Polistes canadensis TaxID=91411 RepID=UPI000718D136|nr:PREDICTED: cilia- and flagella-associated protein 70 [Polistes canadensis]
MDTSNDHDPSNLNLNLDENRNERIIELTIITLENIITNEDTNVIISIEHNSNILGESNPIKIEAGIKESTPVYDVNFSVKIPVLLHDRNSIDLFVSIPILITVLYVNQDKNVTSTVLDTERKKKELKSSKIIGLCNVDLMPILLGENLFTEKLILETMQFKFDGTASSWPNLPYLKIKVKQEDERFFPSDLEYNFLNITIESIFNPPSWFTDNIDYKAGTIIYGEENEEPETIIHDGGKLINDRDIYKTKCWNSLFHLQSRAKLSKYKIACNYNDVKNTLDKELQLQNVVENDITRIEWNSMSRHILLKDAIRKMRDQISKYKYWPFQFIASDVQKVNAKTKSTTKYPIYQCYVDLSELLFPGRTKTRIASQLYTYNPVDLMEKTGFDKNIFLIDNQTKESKEKDKRGRTSMKVIIYLLSKLVNIYNTSIVSEAETLTSEPVITKTNEPVFVIIEIEIIRPLVPCRLAKDFIINRLFYFRIDELITPTDKKPYYPYSVDVVEDQYSKCIETLFNILTESYKDELTCFVQYLYKTGVYLSVRNALKTKVTLLLDHKFQMPSYTLDSCEGQNFIISVYTYLVESMHTIVNQTIEGNYSKDSSIISDSDRFYFYAEEAYELGYINEARKYYTTIIDKSKNDPDAWINYAIFLLKIEDTERAEECCREAILLNNRHKISLLVYGAILMKKRLYREAEIFFRSITDFYPRFVEGWTILHLFYIRTDYYSGRGITIRIAEECMKDKDRDIAINNREPLAWSMIHCPRDSIYTMTITFLLKLHLYDLAGIALAEEMSLTDRSTHLLYYMAVEHYLLHRYEDALSHLKEAQCQYGLDYSISCLMGHCYFQNGDLKEAIKYYEFANMVFDRPDDIYFMQLRMGLCYESKKDYEKAKKVLLNACQSSPTSISWLHVGISFYKLNQLKEAELALIEANKIDNCNADVWGYLCLLNLSLKRYDEFTLCYRQVITVIDIIKYY